MCNRDRGSKEGKERTTDLEVAVFVECAAGQSRNLSDRRNVYVGVGKEEEVDSAPDRNTVLA